MASRSRIFRGIRLKIRSGELQKTADISADHHTFHVIALQKCAREVEEAGRLPGKSVLEQSDLFGAVVVQQISNLIQHRLISSRSRDSIDNRCEITVSPEALAGAAMTENPDTAELHSPYRRRKHQKYP